MRMLTTKLLLCESGTHTGERCLLPLTPCYFLPRLTLLLTFDGRTSICRSYTGRVPAISYEFTATSRRLQNNTTERNLILILVVILNTSCFAGHLAFLFFLSDTSSSVGHIFLFVKCFCRTYLALSDISCVLLLFLSDISTSVGHILLFVVIFVGQI